MSTSKFQNFVTKDFVYKTVNGHDLETTVCVPKDAAPGKHPVVIHWHGGCLINGDKMYEPWVATWLVQLTESKSAIYVSPNYRLLPEATGKDIAEDMTAFYDWFKTSFADEVSKISPNVEADLTQTLVAGESAGGYLATQSALRFPEINFKAVISQYGMIDLEDRHYTEAYPKNLFGTPRVESAVEDYLKTFKPGTIRSSATDVDSTWMFVVEVMRQGRYLEFLGTDKNLFPMRLIDEAESLPPFWFISGKDDELVPIDGTERFIAKIKEKHPETPFLYTLEPGPHGFDVGNVLSDAWVKQGCEFLDKYWP
ncbi:hypothetical protein AAFC00_001863 [Neodothiora populina]|uniref:Alpha/beta hydrolase fold-3 domain-containing protein n=1 Tax=Neodothiora populina TaxID=2781224 RepID=A0ABR3PQF2_9PEZI